ncbi:hypothetical protein WT26_20355 [Burkholderia cepacia]|uniref:Uncharacterized protein n=3 Tax=Burkholderia cepacia complex TaxID=87882 RepID=A0A1B4PW64_BURCE|nr:MULTISPECIES: hypothetical protein [Burkholderia cepacia complex]AOK18143.1 hypothetical protein WT26_20355 [Burkholderia cepacia]AOK24879.1 hypothetical protein WK67_20285 [Burkholderia ubonensis]KVU54503.1 hypothetical protein WK68_25720 [Burkholderia ubonensis]
MAENLKTTGTTNPERDTCVDAQCDCKIIWSLAQQFSMRQIVTNVPTHNHMPDYREGESHASGTQLEKQTPTFVSDPEVRARRIAAAYARVFLEEFHLGDKNKVDRFYWLGLGAFASKQVAATLALWQVRYAGRWTELRKGLGRGNLWLFNDVLAWFYAYAAGADTFFKCVHSRDSSKFVEQVATNFTRQAGYAESIKKIPFEIDVNTGKKKAEHGYLRCTPIIVEGFNKIKEWEAGDDQSRPIWAFKHLLLIAKHEQGEVLQGLIYDDPNFKRWLGVQRAALATSDDTAINESMNAMKYGLSDGSEIALSPVIRALVPNLQLVLTSDDKTENIEFRSDARDRLVLEDYQQRMDWIQKAAEKYDELMQGKRRHTMLGYLADIKKWGDRPDA